MTTTVLSAVDKSRSSLAAAILNTARQSAGAIGVAVFGALAHGDADRIGAGLRITCVVSMVGLGLAALAAARLKGVSPAALTQPPTAPRHSAWSSSVTSTSARCGGASSSISSPRNPPL